MSAPVDRGPFRGAQIPQPPARSGGFTGLAVLLAVCVYAVALPLGLASGDYDIIAGLIMAPIIIGITLPILRRLTAKEEPWVRRVIAAGLYLKLLGAGIRYFVTFSVLGVGDARLYHQSGAILAKAFRGFDFTGQAYNEEVPKLVGTPFIRLITGIIYTVSPAAELSGFMIFSWLGFWGLFLFYRAFRIGVPDGNARRYAVLIFFLPSLVFWPSSIGKESWMLLCLGVVAYGAAKIFTYGRYGFPLVALGLWGTAMVRPHVTLIAFLALSVGYILRPARTGRQPTAPGRKIVGIVVLVIIGALVVSRTQSFFGVDNLDTGTADQITAEVEGQTEQGTSEFETTRPSSPLQYPSAVVGVLFRPFPWESGNVLAAFAALEGVVVLVLLLNPRRFRMIPRAFVRRPYVAFSVTFAALFVYAFSAIGNFGILTRQRTQVLPFVLVLAALPLAIPWVAKPYVPGNRSLREPPPTPPGLGPRKPPS